MIAALLSALALQFGGEANPDNVDTPSANKAVLRSNNYEVFEDADQYVHVFEAPVLKRGDTEVRASWAVIWMDRHEFQKRRSSGITSPKNPDLHLDEPHSNPPEERPSPIVTLFRRMEYTDAVPFADLGREIYIEGPIEYFQNGERRAMAEAIYLDLVEGHGWIANADARLPQRFGGEEQRLHIQAQWLRHSADGSLQADAATVTTCDFDVPHVHITTGDLRIRPTERDSLGAWEVGAEQESPEPLGHARHPAALALVPVQGERKADHRDAGVRR